MAVAGGSGSRPFVGNRRPQEPGRSRQRQPAVPAGGSRCPPPRDPPASGARAAAAGWPGGVREGRRGGGKKRGRHKPAGSQKPAGGSRKPAGGSRKRGRRQPLSPKLGARGEQKEVGGAGASPLPPRPKVDPRRGQEKRALSRAHERHPLAAAGGTSAVTTNEAGTDEWEKRRARKVRAQKTAVHATAAQAMMGDGGHGRRWGRRRRWAQAVKTVGSLLDSGEGRVARPLPPQAHMSTLLPEAVHRPQGSFKALPVGSWACR